jgi:pimeloyl-ACP methyl ester carboxylesterase
MAADISSTTTCPKLLKTSKGCEGELMKKIHSKDGTTIALDRLSNGPPVILVCGGSVDRTANAPLATLLAEHFTVLNYDRRGRGDSGDTAPYGVEREIEDIDAVIAEAGGSAFVYGTSSGAALTLEAAASGLAITKLALWEPPYILEGRPRPPADTARTYTELVSAGRRGDAVEFFMSKVVGLPPEFVAQARNAPWWQVQVALAHTLAYDATIMGDYSLPSKRLASVTTPTLVIDGGASFPWIGETDQALADALPDAQRRTLEGQTHDVAPEALALVLVEFFASA